MKHTRTVAAGNSDADNPLKWEYIIKINYIQQSIKLLIRVDSISICSKLYSWHMCGSWKSRKQASRFREPCDNETKIWKKQPTKQLTIHQEREKCVVKMKVKLLLIVAKTIALNSLNRLNHTKTANIRQFLSFRNGNFIYFKPTSIKRLVLF